MRVNLSVPINSLGYGVVGYNIWKNIREKVDVTLWPIGNSVNLPVKPQKDIVEKINQDIAKQDDYDYTAPTLKVWHENHLAEHIGRGKYVVFPFFERSKFDRRRITHLKSADNIIASSKWAEDILLKETRWLESQRWGDDICVVPCGVDREIFNEETYKVENKCVFLNCGKWEVRKGHDVLYKAFEAAFPDDENVELWMMNSNPFLNAQELDMWQSMYNKPKMKIIDRVEFQEELANDVMSRAFCGVFPARAEGWNLEALEMMSMGKEIIITDYSAHTEFCTRANSFLLDIHEEDPMYDGKWFKGDCGKWASLERETFNQLVDHFRSVYKLWQENPMVLNYEGIETAKKLSWDNTVDKLLEVLFEEN